MVWLSGEEKPDSIKECIESWGRVLPDYTVREWSMKDFPMDEMPGYVHEALQIKKWAFATDYLRLWILYNCGGIYLDSDILMKKRIDDFLDDSFFSFIEYHPEDFKPYAGRIDENGRALVEEHVPGFCMQAAFMGAQAGNDFVKTCMEAYRGRHFIGPDKRPDTNMLAPDIYALCAREYGFVYKDCCQKLGEGMTVYPSSYCGGTLSEAGPENYAVHCCAGSWREKKPEKSRLRIMLIHMKDRIKRAVNGQ